MAEAEGDLRRRRSRLAGPPGGNRGRDRFERMPNKRIHLKANDLSQNIAERSKKDKETKHDDFNNESREGDSEITKTMIDDGFEQF